MLLKADKIEKVYHAGRKNLHVLKGVDITLSDSRIAMILGPSGAGKSTLLHILGGLDAPSKGKVFLDGTDLYAVSDRKRALIRNKRMGFVFQFYHLLPDFSAIENVMLPAMIAGGRGFFEGRKIKAQAEELLKSVGLEERLYHKPSELSGGEAQRVALARALINDPDIVLCDEPTGNLDSKNSHHVMRIIKELCRKKQKMFLIVTHNEDLGSFADKAIYMKDGLMVEESFPPNKPDWITTDY